MTWVFDQAPNVACITSRSVMNGAPVLVVTHFADGDSWSFLDGSAFDPAQAMVVAMSGVLDRHPELEEIASLPPGWTARRAAFGEPWSMTQDDWEPED